MTVQVIRPPVTNVKPDPWPLDPYRVAPEGRWAWSGLDTSLAWLWSPETDRFRSIGGRELVYNGGDVGATSPETGTFGLGYKLPGGDDHNGIGFQEVLPTLDDAFTVLMFFRFDGSFRVGESGVWDAGAAAGQTNGPFGVFKFGGDIDFTISDGATAEALDGPDVTLSAGDHVALVATCSLGAGVHALYQETNGDFASASRTPGITSFAAFPATASNHRIGAWDDGKFRPLEGLIYLAVLIPEVWWTEGQARQWMRDPFGPFRPQYYRFFEEEAADDGTTTVTLTDSLAFNENLDRDFEGDRNVSDGLGFGEVLGADLTVERTMEQEDLAFAENFTRNSVLGRQISDDLSLTEQLVIDRILTRLIEDSLGFAENLDRTVTQSGGAITRTITDTIAFAENLLRDVDLDRLMNENLTFSENLDIIVNDSPISQAVERHWRFQRFQNLRRERRWSDESDMWDS